MVVSAVVLLNVIIVGFASTHVVILQLGLVGQLISLTYKRGSLTQQTIFIFHW